MIITCVNCLKKFEINQDQIPDNGRMLQCGSCHHKWFYTNQVIITEKENSSNNKSQLKNDSQEMEQVFIKTEDPIVEDATINEELFDNNKDTKISIEEEILKKDPQIIDKTPSKNIRFLSKLLVFIISIIALIVLIDTFKEFIALYIPNIEITLVNLFETIKDITLFFKDLF